MKSLPMLRAAAAASLAVAVFAPAAARGAAWLQPTPLNTTNGLGPDVAVDGVGDTTAAWQSGTTDQAAFHAFGASGFRQLPDLDTQGPRTRHRSW